MTRGDNAVSEPGLEPARYDQSMVGGPRKPLFVPRDNDPPGLIQHDFWDRWVRLGIILALLLAAALVAVTFAPAIRRAVTTPREVAPRQAGVAPATLRTPHPAEPAGVL